MEDSLKGVLVAFTLISLFITAILSFLVLFPQEQGISFSGGSHNSYLTVNESSVSSYQSTNSKLESIKNSSSSGFDAWDTEVGFMGSNSVKQSSNTGVQNYKTNIFSVLTTIAKQIFGSGSPIIYVLSIFSLLTSAYLVYLVIKFVRTGQ